MLAMFGPGGYEWIIILIIALLLFGKRLPKVMKSMGEGIRMFKKGVNGDGSEGGSDECDEDTDDPFGDSRSEEETEPDED